MRILDLLNIALQRRVDPLQNFALADEVRLVHDSWTGGTQAGIENGNFEIWGLDTCRKGAEKSEEEQNIVKDRTNVLSHFCMLCCRRVSVRGCVSTIRMGRRGVGVVPVGG